MSVWSKPIVIHNLYARLIVSAIVGAVLQVYGYFLAMLVMQTLFPFGTSLAPSLGVIIVTVFLIPIAVMLGVFTGATPVSQCTNVSLARLLAIPVGAVLQFGLYMVISTLVQIATASLATALPASTVIVFSTLACVIMFVNLATVWLFAVAALSRDTFQPRRDRYRRRLAQATQLYPVAICVTILVFMLSVVATVYVWDHVLARTLSGGTGTLAAALATTFFVPYFSARVSYTFMVGSARRWGCDERSRQGLCTGCGYSLTGNESGVCPECGQTVNADCDEKSIR